MTNKSSVALLLLLLSSLPPPSTSSSSDNPTSFVYAGCSQLKITPDSPYQSNLDSLLSSLINSASFSPYTNFTSSSSSTPVHGLFQCRGDLPTSSCDSCIKSSISQLSALCSASCGGAIQLQGCFLRYGNESFLGQPDTTLVFKKCGPDTGGDRYDSDVLGMRDAVLSGLVASSGPYRVSGAGYVQGMGQCVGDLSAKECGDCVGDAVGQLRSGCGMAVSGEVYLGKCYAKYGSGGVYSSKSHSDDETGKTLAIIIGLMAGVVLIIVFLSFIKRNGNGKH